MLALSLVSCATTSPYYGDNSSYPNGNYPYGTYPTGTYPNGNYPNNVYKSPDGGIYRNAEIYRDRNGNVYQYGRVINNTNVYNRTNLPPGQAKKIYGGEARDYARGQQKKYRRYDKKYKENDQSENRDYRKYDDKQYKDRHDD